MKALAGIVVLGSLLSLPGLAHARGYGLRATTTMASRGVEHPAVKLVPGVAGWYLVLDLPGDGKTCSAELKDVSPTPGPLPKWLETVPNWAPRTTVLLSPDRYVASHTYRMTLVCGRNELASGLVHLQTPSDERVLQRFQLKNEEARSEAGGLTEIAIMPKSAL